MAKTRYIDVIKQDFNRAVREQDIDRLNVLNTNVLNIAQEHIHLGRGDIAIDLIQIIVGSNITLSSMLSASNQVLIDYIQKNEIKERIVLDNTIGFSRTSYPDEEEKEDKLGTDIYPLVTVSSASLHMEEAFEKLRRKKKFVID